MSRSRCPTTSARRGPPRCRTRTRAVIRPTRSGARTRRSTPCCATSSRTTGRSITSRVTTSPRTRCCCSDSTSRARSTVGRRRSRARSSPAARPSTSSTSASASRKRSTTSAAPAGRASLAASSSETRWHLACDACDSEAWLGASATGFDAWCEACQRAQALTAAPDERTRCMHCGARLAAAPRFIEPWWSLPHRGGVRAAWAGDAGPLATLLPERPAFLTDLTPPAPMPGDEPALRELLEAVARGDWRGALALSAPAGPRAAAAHAIAHERLGELPQAITCWDTVLALGDDARARLARGSLLARTGRLADAEPDLWRTGDALAARWSRAAWLVHAAVQTGPPDSVKIARARAEAGAPSA